MPKTLKRGLAVAALAAAFIGGWEGISYVAYLDGGGVPTICRGHTRGVTLGMRASPAECDALFLADIAEHEVGMARCLRNPDALSDQTYVAFLSFTFNVGVQAACGSTAFRLINAGDVRGACQQLPRWNKDGGKVIWGLTRRRAAERDLCLEGLE